MSGQPWLAGWRAIPIIAGFHLVNDVCSSVKNSDSAVATRSGWFRSMKMLIFGIVLPRASSNKIERSARAPRTQPCPLRALWPQDAGLLWKQFRPRSPLSLPGRRQPCRGVAMLGSASVGAGSRCKADRCWSRPPGKQRGRGSWRYALPQYPWHLFQAPAPSPLRTSENLAKPRMSAPEVLLIDQRRLIHCIAACKWYPNVVTPCCARCSMRPRTHCLLAAGNGCG